MTKISFVAILRWRPGDAEPVVLGSAAELTDYSFFQRGSIREFMTFTGKTVVRKTAPGARQTVKAQAYMCHAVVRDNHLAAVVFCDEAYPSRAAMSVAMQTMYDFESTGIAWQAADKDGIQASPLCEQALAKYQARLPSK
jgi:synaptobrevin homolog YKT6